MFKYKLLAIKKDLENQRNKNSIMEESVKRLLDNSLNNYNYDLKVLCSSLVSFNNMRLLKSINRSKVLEDK